MYACILNKIVVHIGMQDDSVGHGQLTLDVLDLPGYILPPCLLPTLGVLDVKK